MSNLEQSVDVARAPEEIWSVVGDFDKDDRRRRVERMRSDPSGSARAGTSTHEVLRFLGSTYVTYTTVTDMEPARRLAYERGDEGTTVRGYRRVEEAPGGARFVEGLEIKLSGPMRLLEPLLARPYARRMCPEVHALKILLEKSDP